MSDEITGGSWIEWPGSIGRDRGRVNSVDEDGYNVLQKVGNSWIGTFVPFGDRVRKIDPPEGEE